MNPANTTGPDGDTLYYGDLDATHKVQLFLEMRDRGSRRVMESLLGTLRKGADDGKYVVKFHFAGMIDDTAGGSGSRNALGALGAAADVGQKEFADYMAALFEVQPFPPGYDTYSETSVLLSAADGVDGLRSADFDKKVTDGTYLTWAGTAIADFESCGVVGTPIGWYDEQLLQVVKGEDGPAVSPQEFLAQLPG